jgi:hypothetical protein
MGTLRTPETEAKYDAWKAARTGKEICRLCEMEPIKEFTYWKIISNDYPYDQIAKIHNMVVPLRHVTEKDLTREERDEFEGFKDQLHVGYTYIMEATHHQKSIPGHYHLHLVELKDQN